jgi:hypothetical protein
LIAFATLLLGLIIGPQPVELLVGSSVASVELSLDGRPVGSLDGDDWTITCDFGQRLEPHELVAVAFDADHNELGRTKQWVNMPSRPAEAILAVEKNPSGVGLIAHLTWESVVEEEPLAITALFDGRQIEVSNPRRIVIPDFDPDQLHHLRIELDFSDNVSSVVETTFAGAYVDRVRTELTAVPVVLDKRARVPPLYTLSGHFEKNSQPLRVVAVEDGPAEIIVVRDESARRDLNRLHRSDREGLRRRARGGRSSDRETARTRFSLTEDMQLRFLWPLSDRQERSGYDLEIFPPSREFTSRDGGLFWLLTYVRQPFPARGSYRYADAVAAAGLLAAGRNRRRAVVLLVGKDFEAHESSQFKLSVAADYLDSLGVPLHLWTTTRAREEQTDPARFVDVSSFDKLGRAIGNLYEEVDRQRIIWLDGTHLPQSIDFRRDELPLRLIRMAEDS